jgi:hypothetical protein
MATPIQVTFDCADPDRLATFWATALGYKKQDPPPGYATWPEFLAAQGVPEDQWNAASAIVDPEGIGPRIYFQQVPEPKTLKNRVHLDVNVGGGRDVPDDERRGRVNAAVERLLGAGATRLRACAEHGESWVVMQDPEGNEFCLQ